jgi:hypothetical protein
MPIAGKMMYLAIITLSEINQTQTSMTCFFHMWNFKKDMNIEGIY